MPSNTRPPVAQLVRASDQNSEDQGLNPSCLDLNVFFTKQRSIGKIFIWQFLLRN